MVTNKEVIYQVKALSEQSQLTRDGWSDVWIYNETLKYRARILNQKLEQKVPISDFNYQDSPCLNLIEVPKNECDIEVGDGCTIYRTEYIIPRAIKITSVYNPLNNKQYTLIEKTQVRFRQNTRFSSLNDKSYSYLSDTGMGVFLYVVSKNPLLKSVIIKGIFYNPLEIQTYPSCEGKVKFPCRSFYDYEFKLDDSLRTTVNEMMLSYFYKLKYGPNDLLNNNIINV